MKFIEEILNKALSHPAWAGIAGLVAIFAFFISLYQVSSTNSQNSQVPNKTVFEDIKYPSEVSFPNKGIKTGEKRVALIMGNSNYENLPDLRHPRNSAKEMARFLESVNFEVHLLIDSTEEEMGRAFRYLTQNMDQDTVSLFYFSGYAFSIMGKNYLMPIDAEVTTESRILVSSLSFDWLLNKQYAGQQMVSFVILDTAQPKFDIHSEVALSYVPNQFNHEHRQLSKNTIMTYSSNSSLASESTEHRNSYTYFLINELSKPGTSFEKAFQKSRDYARRATNGQQNPVMQFSVDSQQATNFVFREKEPATVGPAPTPQPNK